MQGRFVSLHFKQRLQETNRCALQLCSGRIITSNRPDLSAIAQVGLDKGVEKLALDNRVMNVQVLALAVQAEHSFVEGL